MKKEYHIRNLLSFFTVGMLYAIIISITKALFTLTSFIMNMFFVFMITMVLYYAMFWLKINKYIKLLIVGFLSMIIYIPISALISDINIFKVYPLAFIDSFGVAVLLILSYYIYGLIKALKR